MSNNNIRTLYLECNAGISGDMTVAALLDLGADADALRQVLESIPVSGFKAEIGRVKKAGLDCCDFRVILDAEHENHDHDMEYLHGHEHRHGEHFHVHENERHGEHSHGHEYHHHTHRGMAEISRILEQTAMTNGSRSLAFRIFDILAQAEARAHGVLPEEVHFHEVGAIDSIVDITAAAVCLDNLGIEKVIIRELCEGRGTVRCQHGILPVPVPATVNIMEAHDLPVHFIDCEGEFVTPTGAAIAAAIMTSDRLPERFVIKKTGLGAGKRNYERASILRAMIIEEEAGVDEKQTSQKNADDIYKLETNVDDCSGEALGYTMEQLWKAGARDVYYTPVYMKKNRPGWQINVISDEERVSLMEQIIFKNTTTIGIRRCRYERTVLERESRTVDTPFGEAQVKVCKSEGETYYYPEYESVAALCKKNEASFSDVYHKIIESVR